MAGFAFFFSNIQRFRGLTIFLLGCVAISCRRTPILIIFYEISACIDTFPFKKNIVLFYFISVLHHLNNKVRIRSDFYLNQSQSSWLLLWKLCFDIWKYRKSKVISYLILLLKSINKQWCTNVLLAFLTTVFLFLFFLETHNGNEPGVLKSESWSMHTYVMVNLLL